MTTCIVCESQNVEMFFDLGETALANKFLTQEEISRGNEAMHPLRVGFCHDCGHVQLMEHVPPADMFDDYLYISSMSETLTKHLRSVSAMIGERQNLTPDDLAVDIGSNDGTLLTGYEKFGNRVLGVDPAQNLVPLAAEKGVETFTAYFGEETAKKVLAEYGPAKAMTSTNSFPHIPGLNDFIKGVKLLLADDGVFVIEAHYCVDMFEQLAFDTIYHEHVSFWTLAPMMRLMERHGLQVVRVERLPLHHGQLRVFVQHQGYGAPDETVGQILELEKSLGIPGMAPCREFADKSNKLKVDLHDTLSQIKSKGQRVGGYGAPAKANTLLGFLGLGPQEVPYIADLSPLKQGRYTPGTHIPVVPAEHVLEDQPDYLVIFAWNFADEIMKQQAEYKARGGQFILPVPKVKII